MKSFITDPIENGRFVLRLQCEGCRREQVKEMLKSSCITAYAMPSGHSFEAAWLFRLFFNDRYIVEFSSACTGVGGWQEVGSLNLKVFLSDGFIQNGDRDIFIKTEVEGFIVEDMECLVYEDSDVYAESGVIFRSSSGEEIIIAAGIPSGSVSVRAPFSKGEFQPEFSESDYQRRAM